MAANRIRDVRDAIFGIMIVVGAAWVLSDLSALSIFYLICSCAGLLSAWMDRRMKKKGD